MKTLFLSFLITILFGQYSKGQSVDFEFNESIAIKYAIIAMEEYEIETSQEKRDFRELYDINNPLLYGRLLNDCKNHQQRVVLVTFNRFDGKSSASVYMFYSKDNFFTSFLDRNYSISSGIENIDGFKQYDLSEFLFGCGL